MRGRVVKAVGEFVRKEVRVAGPAATRAAAHGVQEFFKKFAQEYAKERGKR